MEMEPGSRSSNSQTNNSILAAIRTNYLQARPPQQIKELIDLFQGSKRDNHSSSIKTRVNLSIREKKDGGDDVAVESSGSKGGGGEDEEGNLDKLGIMTGSEKLCISSEMEEGRRRRELEEVTPGTNIIRDEDITRIMHKLHSVTVGFSPEVAGSAAAGGNVDRGGEVVVVDQNNSKFLHPPVQYRIAFAKHIIKQMEAAGGNWSAPQGGYEEDIEDPVEQAALLLEKWYDTLEKLSSSEVLSERFYRLYEIKLPPPPPHNQEDSGGSSSARQEIVKIFENETSFVADGTTGLVTWKAAMEFAKWLCQETGSAEHGLREALENSKWILELGCGCGFLAVVVTKYLYLTLDQYIATDGSLAALERAKENVEENFPPSRSNTTNGDNLAKSKVRFERVDWENEGTKESFTQLVDGMTGIYGTDRGVLLGTDIVFDSALVPHLVELINDFLERMAGRVLIACTIRNPETMQSLKTSLGASNLKAVVVWTWEDGEILDIKQ